MRIWWILGTHLLLPQFSNKPYKNTYPTNKLISRHIGILQIIRSIHVHLISMVTKQIVWRKLQTMLAIYGTQPNLQVFTLENEIDVDILYLLQNFQKEIIWNSYNFINQSKVKLFLNSFCEEDSLVDDLTVLLLA